MVVKFLSVPESFWLVYSITYVLAVNNLRHDPHVATSDASQCMNNYRLKSAGCRIDACFYCSNALLAASFHTSFVGFSVNSSIIGCTISEYDSINDRNQFAIPIAPAFQFSYDGLWCREFDDRTQTLETELFLAALSLYLIVPCAD